MKKVTYKSVAAVPAKPATQKRVEKHYCDICSDQIKGRVRVCTLCKRDCHDWWEKKDCSASDDRDYGDYPAYYCKICHDLKFGKYDKEYYDIQEECEKKEEALEAKILKESLESTIS